MNTNVRNAVRCFLIENDKVVCIKYKEKRVGFYDIPGGKIEENETEEQAVIREFQEETGLIVKNPISRGIMYVNYPDKKFIFHTYIAKEYTNEIKQFEENNTYWLPISELISNKKRFINTIMLEQSFIGILQNEKKEFNITIDVDNDENIINLNLEVKDKI